jgi:hypothetical protein
MLGTVRPLQFGVNLEHRDRAFRPDRPHLPTEHMFGRVGAWLGGVLFLTFFPEETSMPAPISMQ